MNPSVPYLIYIVQDEDRLIIHAQQAVSVRTREAGAEVHDKTE